ncbi:MAG: hypothetical protein IT481_10080 [Gammaproteobacteria bacterium]|nr:hypothetical protein [Gammaproteobacteria bacterium]
MNVTPGTNGSADRPPPRDLQPRRDDPAYREIRFEFRDFGRGGLSAATLATHLELYRGYLAQTNELVGAIVDPALRRAAGTVARPREAASRRLSFELNGVKLHEWYFEQLTGRGGGAAPASSSVATEAMDVAFGGFDGWRADVEALAATRGIGWVVSGSPTSWKRRRMPRSSSTSTVAPKRTASRGGLARRITIAPCSTLEICAISRSTVPLSARACRSSSSASSSSPRRRINSCRRNRYRSAPAAVM